MITEFAPVAEAVSPQPFDVQTAYANARRAVAAEVAYAEQQLAADTAIVDHDLLTVRMNSFCHEAEERDERMRYRDRMYETLAVHAGFVPDELPIPIEHNTKFTVPTLAEARNNAAAVAENNRNRLEHYAEEDRARLAQFTTRTEVSETSELRSPAPSERRNTLSRVGKRIGVAAVSLAVVGADAAFALATKQHIDHSQYMDAARDSFGLLMATAAIGARLTQLMGRRHKRKQASSLIKNGLSLVVSQ